MFTMVFAPSIYFHYTSYTNPQFCSGSVRVRLARSSVTVAV
jgi:hypothetical protein